MLTTARGWIATLLARPIAGAFAAAERHMVVDAGGQEVHDRYAGLIVALEVRGEFQRGCRDSNPHPDPGSGAQSTSGLHQFLEPSHMTAAGGVSRHSTRGIFAGG